MKVKAAVARAHGEALRLEGLTLVEPRPDEILVKMIACGVAQVDLDAIDGRLATPLPFVPGSEGAGIVERIGEDVTGLAPGDAVVMGFDFCGQCAACAAGRPRACVAFAAHNLAGRRIDRSSVYEEQDVYGRFFGQSSFATHVVCRAARAIKLSNGSPLELFAALGGECLVGAGAVLRGLNPETGNSLLVFGANAVGLTAVMVARARGAEPIVIVEADERRRDLACEVGASLGFHPDDHLPDLVRSVAADGVNFAFETTGTLNARRACLESLVDRGVCALVGPIGEDEVAMSCRSSQIVRAEDLASPDLIAELAALHARGDLPLERLVDFFQFEHVNDAIEALRSHAVAKPILRFSIGAFGDLDRARVEGDQADGPTDDSERETSTGPALVKA